MRVAVIEKNVYKFAELSDKAKEAAKQTYLDTCRQTDEFNDMVREDLNSFFPGANLKLEYSLSCCQGDGLNVYGTLPTKCMRNCAEQLADDSNLLCIFYKKDKMLTDEEWNFVQDYADQHGDIVLPRNRHHAYCIAYQADIIDDSRFIPKNPEEFKTLLKYNSLVHSFFNAFCDQWERFGYDYFHGTDLTDKDYQQIFEEMEWEFLESGEPFFEVEREKDSGLEEAEEIEER